MNSPKLNPQAGEPRQMAAVDGWHFDQAPAVETARLIGLALPGRSQNPAAEAFEGLKALNERLADAPEDEIRHALGRQAALLEALTLSYTRRALESGRADHAALFQGTALKCQRAHLNVLGALHKLSLDQRNAEAIEAD